MRKKVVLSIVFVAVAAQALLPLDALAQSKDEGIRLYMQARALQIKAQTGADLQAAAQTYQQALAIFERSGFKEGIGKAANNLGVIYKNWGQYDKAASHYEKCLHAARDMKDRSTEGAALLNLGNVYRTWGQYDKAAAYYEKCLHAARDVKDRNREAQALNNLGLVHECWGQYDKAVSYYEKALAIARDLKDPKQEGLTLNGLGNVYYSWGQYAKAVSHYEKCLAIARSLKDPKHEEFALTGLGNAYYSWGQYAKAVSHYEKCLAIARDLKDRNGEALTLNNLGDAYRAWGQYSKAVEYFEKSLAITRKIGDVKQEGQTLNNLGVVYQAWGEYDRALAHFEQGLAIYKKIGVPEKPAIENIGNLYLDKGQLDKAEPFVKQGNVAVLLGRLALAKGDWPAAKKFYEIELKRAEVSRRADTLFISHTGLGMAYEGMGENPNAAEHFRKAVELTEALRSGLGEVERETFLDVKIQGFYRTTPYEGLARVLAKMNKPLEALKQSEYTKARVFAEAISKRSRYTASDVPEQIREKDTSLANELAALTKVLQAAYEKQNKEVIASLEPQVKAAKERLAAHVEMLRKQYPLFAATKYPQPMDLAQTAVKDNEWVLSYDVTDPGLIVYLTKGKTLKKALFKPVTRKDLDGLVRQFREPLDIKDKETIEEKIAKFDFGLGKKLAVILLADMLPELPKDAPLIIVPADCLSVLPFEMLVLNDGGKIVEKDGRPNTSGAEFFGDRNPISYYQSITALTLARNFAKQKGSGSKTLVMCDPVFSDDDPRLVRERKETRRALLDTITSDVMSSARTQNGLIWKRMALTGELGQSLKKTDPGLTDMYEGLQATKATFKQQKLDQYKNIVFATHGYAGTDLGGLKEPVLVLTLVNQPPNEDGFLRMSEVMGLKLNADIVALTACQSGLGKRISGEGTMGMGRAFQYAGAKSTLMTLWSVAQKSSVQLTESFFRHLKEGKPKLEALKLARDEIRKNGYDHPFFWASFILVGEVN